MRVVVQRVLNGSVHVEGELIASIERGFVLLVGVAEGDGSAEADWLAGKVAGLRVFEDDQGKMNRSLLEVGGEALVVSQFTLYADANKGRRPSFVAAARPERAELLVERFAAALSHAGVPTRQGQFQAHMQVTLVNDGPVTILLERSANT